jgi:ABC-2 type transport system ATP-binding protein
MSRQRSALCLHVLRDILKRCVSRGTTVFLTSHVLEIVEKLCSDVGIIDKGRLIHQSKMEEIQQSGTLEDKFIRTVADGQIEKQKLSWLEG